MRKSSLDFDQGIFFKLEKTKLGSDLNFVPTVKGKKYSFQKGWNKLCDDLPADEIIENYERQLTKDKNFLISIGKYNGISCLDIDTDVTSKELYNLLPFSPLGKIGNRGLTLFYSYDENCPVTRDFDFCGLKIQWKKTGALHLIPPSFV